MSNICRYYATYGSCYYGDSCNFSHNTSHFPVGPPAYEPPERESKGHTKSQRPCRNIELYGFCKFGKACDYNHDIPKGQDTGGSAETDMAGDEDLQAQMEYMTLNSKKDPASFGLNTGNSPMNRGSTQYSNAVKSGVMEPGMSPLYSGAHAQPFQPAAQQSPQQQATQQPLSQQPQPQLSTPPHMNAAVKQRASPVAFYPSSPASPMSTQGNNATSGTSPPTYASMIAKQSPLRVQTKSSTKTPEEIVRPPNLSYMDLSSRPSGVAPSAPGMPGVAHGGTTYYYDTSSALPMMYAGPQGRHMMGGMLGPAIGGRQPHAQSQFPTRRNMQSFFMSENIRQDIMKKNALILAALDPEDERYKEMGGGTLSVGQYHSLYPLDSPLHEKNAKVFGYITSVYKCISSTDGFPYALRRVEDFRLTNKYALHATEIWKQLIHPNIVSLRNAFVSKDFDDTNSLYFVYDFHPGSETLESRYFAQMGNYIPEPVLWSYVVQIASALKVVHSAGLACRIIDPSKILLTGKNRVRINCTGIFDVINYESEKDVTHFQREDLLALGKVVLSLGCKSAAALNNLSESIEYLGTQYSAELKNFVVTLLRQPSSLAYPSIDQVCGMLTPYFLMEVEHLHNYTDLAEGELAKEVENGRLFRALVKMGFLNERPEYEADPSWSDTGEHYILKLFRDYLFHQVHENGSPSVDFGHIVDCLNKLDVGTEEKVLLMPRDESSVLVVSYKELKRSIENAFENLFRKQGQPTGPRQQPVPQQQGMAPSLAQQQQASGLGPMMPPVYQQRVARQQPQQPSPYSHANPYVHMGQM